MSNIAIIPARSGSKGLKDKNIKNLNGKPLLAYTIEAAIQSRIYDVVMVSTDSEEYADIASAFGAEVPFLRSVETSSDSASSWDVVKEVLHGYETLGVVFDMFTLLQPTSPLRTAKDIISAYQLYNENNAKAVISVCPMEHSPLWCNTLPKDLSMDGFLPENNNVQRQKLDTFYRINGALYMVSIKDFFNNQDIYREGSFAYIMSSNNSIDIDSEFDFLIAETVFNNY